MVTLEKIIRKVKQRTVGLELTEYRKLKPMFTNKIGLEIGGPSAIFKADNILPIYPNAKRIDGVNFSTLTVWENKIDEGLTYTYDGKQKGYQFILEASVLTPIHDNTYDFLLSSHSLEHCANVIKTLEEWKRVLSPEGIMTVILPDKNYTFDHKRKITTFSHLMEDYQNDVDESDLTHLDEIMTCHDLSRDPDIADKDSFTSRSLQNINNRCLHHHVFDVDLMQKLFNYLNMDVLFTDLQRPFHIIIVAKKRI